MANPTGDPARFDFRLIPGDTLNPGAFTLVDEDGAVFDLTGASAVCQIRSEPAGEIVLAPTVTVTDDVGGEFVITASAAATTDVAPQIARYAVRFTFADASVRTILEGNVSVTPSVVS